MTTNPTYIFVAFAAVMIGLSCWSIIDKKAFLSRTGRMKRGVEVWTEPLPEETIRFLRIIPNNSIYGSKGAFLKKQNNAVLVQPHLTQFWLGISVRHRSRSFAYVAYIDIHSSEPTIQYRLSTFSFLSLLFGLFWTAMVVGASLLSQKLESLILLLFLSLFIVLGHTLQRRKILKFIQDIERLHIHVGNSSREVLE